MGIPGMFEALEGKGVMKTRMYRHEAQGQVGPCIVFHDAILPQLILRDWRRQPTDSAASGPVGYCPSNGGRLTQFRAFCACYIKQLVQEYHCTIVWVRDGGVNDKLNTFSNEVCKTVSLGCVHSDSKLESTEYTANKGTLDVVSQTCWPMNGFTSTDNSVLEAIGKCGEGLLWGTSAWVVSAAGQCTDGEVWRQARKLVQRYGNERRTFLLSCDTEMLFFRQTPPDVGVVLLPSAGMHQKHPISTVNGAEWAWDLIRDVASCPKLLRLSYCTVTDDVAYALGVEPRLLPILAACLGGDLSAFDPSVYDMTVCIKSALVDMHFDHGSAVAQEFKSLAKEDIQARTVVSNMNTTSRTTWACPHGVHCHRPSCYYTHPSGGNMWCSDEEILSQQCCRPHCRFRHCAPMAFEVAPTALKSLGVPVHFPGRAIFQTWGEAMEYLANIRDEHKSSHLGVGLRVPIGDGVIGSEDLRYIILEKTIDLVRTPGICPSTDRGKIDVEGCVRNLCQRVWNVSDDGDLADALTRAIRIYDIPSHDGDALPAILLAPTRQLETYRIRECYLPGPYLVPRDSGYLHYATEHLRSALGKELGIEAAVEGFQVGSMYYVRMLPSEEPPWNHEAPTAASTRVEEALGFGSDSHQPWLQDLHNIVQDLHHACVKSSLWILLQNPTRWQKLLPQTLLSRESVGALKTVILGLALWQRALLEDVTGKIPQQQEAQREEVEPLERWEIRAFVSSCILSWTQLQITACPFNLLASFGDTESNDDTSIFSSIPEERRRRIFVLTAQMFELMKDVKETTQMLDGAEGHRSKGVDEIIFNPEAIFSFYTAVGGLQATDEMDTQVRAKLVAVLNSPTTKVLRATYDNAEVWEGFVGVCDRLVDHLTSIRSWSPKTSDAGGREYFA